MAPVVAGPDALAIVTRALPSGTIASVAAQRTIAQEDHASVGGIHVRMGMHTGNADERGGDYFGPSVNRVARLMSVGDGGQILVSARLGGYVDAKYQELGELRESTETWSHEQLTTALIQQLDKGAIETLCAEGAAWPLEQAVAEALKV